MTTELEFDPDDWRGRGDWDDMDVPKDPKEAAYLRLLAKKRQRPKAEPRAQPNEWPQDEIDLLVKLWGEGLSATEISRHLGGRRSRCAVMGRINRMGLIRPEIYNETNQKKARATGKRCRAGWSKGHNQLFAKTDASERAKRLWRRDPLDDTVLTFAVNDLLDETFDAVDPGWGDPVELMAWAA